MQNRNPLNSAFDDIRSRAAIHKHSHETESFMTSFEHKKVSKLLL